MSGSPAASLTPSDSISQLHSWSSQVSVPLRPQSAIRPPQYPLKILWTLEDCRDDPTVNVTEANKSCPLMERAVHHADGRMVSTSEYNAIKTLARMIKSELWQL